VTIEKVTYGDSSTTVEEPDMMGKIMGLIDQDLLLINLICRVVGL